MYKENKVKHKNDQKSASRVLFRLDFCLNLALREAADPSLLTAASRVPVTGTAVMAEVSYSSLLPCTLQFVVVFRPFYRLWREIV